MKKVTDSVYVESEISVCNTSIVATEKGVVVIDTPMAPENARKWAKKAGRYGPVRYVINTEPHGDHISGNCYFGGTLIAHEGTRDAILSSRVEDMEAMLQRWAPGTLLDTDFRYRPPDITLSERLTFYLGDHTFHLIGMPGHTPYQLAVYVPEERVVFTSDNINLGMPFFGMALPDEWLKTLKDMEKLDVDFVVPGHGEVTDKSAFSKMHDIVTTWINAVKNAIDKGMTLEETQEKVTMIKQFPDIPHDEQTAGMVKVSIKRIYEYYEK